MADPKTELLGPIGTQTDILGVDAAYEGRGVTWNEVVAKLEKEKPSFQFVELLWNDRGSESVRDAFMANGLWNSMAASDKDLAALKSGSLAEQKLHDQFLEYCIQDYFYLIDQVKFRATRLTSIPSSDLDDLGYMAESVPKGFKFAAGWRDDVQKGFKLSEEAFRAKIRDTDRSVAELAYANYLLVNAGRDDWFNTHVITVACLYGWSKLALALYDKYYRDKPEKQNTWFYKNFIASSLTFDANKQNPLLGSSAQKVSTFLDLNEKQWSAATDKPKWKEMFRTTLRLELALAMSGTSPYGQ